MPDSPVAIVTGATGLLGRALVDAYAERGYLVVAHGRRERPSQLPDSVDYLVGDLRREDDVAALIDAASARGYITALINNAADMDLGQPWPMSAPDWLAMMDSSLVSAVRVTQAAIAHLADGAAVVNVSSVEAAAAFPNHAHYAAAKAALESYTRSLALELAPRGIRANAVAPGVIDRPGLARDWPDGWAWWSATCPLGRPVTALEVAEVVAFLTSGQASGVSGSVIPVDGGWTSSARLG